MALHDGVLVGLSVQRASSAQQVAAAIREQLLLGEVAPGTRLRDQVLAASLQVSRNTVREAMQILASEGLVRQHFHHGVTVAELDLDELADAYRVRRVLELAGVAAARLRDQLGGEGANSGGSARGVGPIQFSKRSAVKMKDLRNT